jgi:2-polyprenyl-6-methoxyphenol hydroxylase-like FAD-dependent oxidoreductase
MTAPEPIAIVGGGLAGLSLGIGLRRRGIPVTVWEAGHYPRHRVCGEFISGRGQGSLERLGLWEPIIRAGAITASTAAFFTTKTHSPVRALPQPALCASRLVLDALLAEHLEALGGTLRQGERWLGKDFGEGVVRASGRRVKPVENGWRWFGLKVHARKAPVVADLEMHLLPNGYVGICRLAEDTVNVCGLFRRRKDESDASKTWRQILFGHPTTPLHQRLQDAVLDEDSFCSVAGLSLRPQRATTLGECCVGDALTMIPPVTGNGMSMAFESAELAIDPLAAYSRGEIPWAIARKKIALACDERFAQRLAWARWLQWLMFAPGLQDNFGKIILGWQWLWRAMFGHTR